MQRRGRRAARSTSRSAPAAARCCIVGPNGAGKTSVLMMILGALAPRRGRVSSTARRCSTRARGVDVPVERRRIGFVPQRYALFPHLDVLANVAYGVAAPSRAERERGAREALAELDAAALAPRRPAELSGGEMQRVALARALAGRPRALLLDEPLAALDVSVRRDVRRFLAERLRALGDADGARHPRRGRRRGAGRRHRRDRSGRGRAAGRLADLARARRPNSSRSSSPAARLTRQPGLQDATGGYSNRTLPASRESGKSRGAHSNP